MIASTKGAKSQFIAKRRTKQQTKCSCFFVLIIICMLDYYISRFALMEITLLLRVTHRGHLQAMGQEIHPANK